MDAPSTIAPPAPAPVIVDVWTRTAPKYRIRAAIMLCILAGLFGGLCCFTFWLRTGDSAPWLSERYGELMARSFQPTGSEQITLSNLLTSPIDVQDVHVHAVIMGLLFASLSSIPILIAILYRFPFSVIFAGLVFFLAAMPWLGLTVLLGCAFASMRRFRFTFRYASALVGLIPVAVYFAMASWEPAGGARSIHNQALLYAPWVLALLSSCVICAMGIGAARLIDYRPGGVGPILAVLFAAPVYLFHTQVGRDELEYRVLAQACRGAFGAVDVDALARRQAAREWSQGEEGSYAAAYAGRLKEETDEAIAAAQMGRADIVHRCDEFVEQYSTSRYVANVLYQKARAMDQRIMRDRLMQNGRIEFHADVPSPLSSQTWQTLRERFPTSRISGVARYHLAIIEARQGRLDAALTRLDEIIRAHGDPPSEPPTPPTPPEGLGRLLVFQRTDPAAGLGIDAQVTFRDALRLRELIVACREDATRPYEEVFQPGKALASRPVHPTQLLLAMDPSDPNYAANLGGLQAAFPDSATAGFVSVRLALTEPAISRRIQHFRDLTLSLAGTASGAEAMFHLAEVLQEDSLIADARLAYTQLTRDYPESCWARESRERLSSLAMVQQTEGQ